MSITKNEAHVAYTNIGKVCISTVVLPFPHDKDLYETMIFGGKFDEYQERYRTKDEAIIGHYNCVEKVKKWL